MSVTRTIDEFETYPEVAAELETEPDHLKLQSLQLVTPDGDTENTLEEFNTLDLQELFATDEFTDADRAFAFATLNGQKVCVDEMRSGEWAIVALSKGEFIEFVQNIPELKRRITDILAQQSIRSIWSRSERGVKTYYWLLLGQDTETDSPTCQRMRGKTVSRSQRVLKYLSQTAPEDGSFEELWTFHRRRIQKVAAMLLRNYRSPLLSPNDLTQEVGVDLVRRYAELGPEAFKGGYIARVIEGKLADQLRRINPRSRTENILIKKAQQLKDDGLPEEVIYAKLQAAHKATEPARLQRVVSGVIESRGYRTKPIIYLEDLAGFDVACHDDTSEEGALSVAQLLDTYLHRPSTAAARERWPQHRTERLREVARARFIEGQPMETIAQGLGVTESRVSQIVTEISQILRINLTEAGLASDDTADLLGLPN